MLLILTCYYFILERGRQADAQRIGSLPVCGPTVLQRTWSAARVQPIPSRRHVRHKRAKLSGIVGSPSTAATSSTTTTSNITLRYDICARSFVTGQEPGCCHCPEWTRVRAHHVTDGYYQLGRLAVLVIIMLLAVIGKVLCIFPSWIS